MQRYVVVFEKAATNWAAFSPDVPGCIATGETKEDAARNMREALELHLEGLRAQGLPIPQGSLPSGAEDDALDVEILVVA